MVSVWSRCRYKLSKVAFISANGRMCDPKQQNTLQRSAISEPALSASAGKAVFQRLPRSSHSRDRETISRVDSRAFPNRPYAAWTAAGGGRRRPHRPSISLGTRDAARLEPSGFAAATRHIGEPFFGGLSATIAARQNVVTLSTRTTSPNLNARRNYFRRKQPRPCIGRGLSSSSFSRLRGLRASISMFPYSPGKSMRCVMRPMYRRLLLLFNGFAIAGLGFPPKVLRTRLKNVLRMWRLT